MKKIIIGIIICIFVSCMVSLLAAVLYDSSNVKIEQLNYTSTNDENKSNVNNQIYKLNNYKLPTIVIK